jgi:high mobility group protein B1
MAQQDRQRYDKEKAAYKGPWKVPIVKHPNAPKKPMSAFLAFGNQRRKAVAEANPSMNGTQISYSLAKLWRNAPDDIKGEYRKKEAYERALYKQRRAIWEAQQQQADKTGYSTSETSESRQSPASVSCPESSQVASGHCQVNNDYLTRLNEEYNQSFQCDLSVLVGSSMTSQQPSFYTLPNEKELFHHSSLSLLGQTQPISTLPMLEVVPPTLLPPEPPLASLGNQQFVNIPPLLEPIITPPMVPSQQQPRQCVQDSSSYYTSTRQGNQCSHGRTTTTSTGTT